MELKGWKNLSILLLTIGIFFILLPIAIPSVSPASIDTMGMEPASEPIKMLFPAAQPLDIQAVDPNTKDQSQENFNSGIIISQNSAHLSVMQDVVNDRTPLTGVSVLIGYKGSVTEPIYIAIQKNPLEDPETHAAGYIYPSALEPNTYAWVTLDITDNPYPDYDCWILLYTEDVFSSDKYWVSALGNKNPYPKGSLWLNRPETGWESILSQDLAFITYTTDPDGGEMPLLSITFPAWSIMSYLTGLSSLCFAAVSGFKGFRVL